MRVGDIASSNPSRSPEQLNVGGSRFPPRAWVALVFRRASFIGSGSPPRKAGFPASFDKVVVVAQIKQKDMDKDGKLKIVGKDEVKEALELKKKRGIWDETYTDGQATVSATRPGSTDS
jgi:hypothetical protein